MKPSVRSTIVIGAVAIAAAWVSANASSGRELLFAAPIQKLDQGTDTVSVLGQSFNADTSQLTVGEIVKVYGVLQKDGTVTDALVQATEKYGANGDPVFLKGIVTDADPAVGHVEIDGLTVDYTSQLASSEFAIPSVGDVIEVSGLQPTTQGVLVADATGDDAYALQAGGATGAALPVSALQRSLAGAIAAQLTGQGAAQLTGQGAAQLTGQGAAQLTGQGAAQLTGQGAAQLTGQGVR